MSNPLVLIWRTDKILEAYIIKGRLEAAGISAFIFDDQMLSTNWLYSEALGGVRVMVLASQFEEAIKVLKETATVSDYEAFDTCPLCQSNDVARLKPPLFLVLLIFLFLDFLYMRETRNRKCRTCGHQWSVKNNRDD